jgi:hypothetical protein
MNGWEEIGQLIVNQPPKNKKDISKKVIVVTQSPSVNYEDYQLMAET